MKEIFKNTTTPTPLELILIINPFCGVNIIKSLQYGGNDGQEKGHYMNISAVTVIEVSVGKNLLQ